MAALKEFSVVFSDHALNHMSAEFGQVMREVDATLCELHHADKCILIPGSGTSAMESVARCLLSQPDAQGGSLVVRNGWFSFRWTQIVEGCGLQSDRHVVLKARRTNSAEKGGAGSDGETTSPCPFEPPPVEDVVAAIRQHKPSVVFVPHVETSSGILLPDSYLQSVAEACQQVKAFFVVDCIASGALYVSLKDIGADVVVTAPQKGYSSPSGFGIVLLNGARAHEAVKARAPATQVFGGSFALDLTKWSNIADAYRGGSHMYHATMPTDTIRTFRDQLRALRAFGFERATACQWEIGRTVRARLQSLGYPSVAATGFEAPGVVVSFTNNDLLKSGASMIAQGVQIAAGVPLMCDEGPDFKSFRLGLFGLAKYRDVAAALEPLFAALDRVTAST